MARAYYKRYRLSYPAAYDPDNAVAEAYGVEEIPSVFLIDKAGVVRPSPRHMLLHYQYALAPWDDCLYMLAAGHLVRYDPAARAFSSSKPSQTRSMGGRRRLR